MAEGRAFHWQDLFYSYSSLPGTSEDVMFPMLPDQPGDPGPASLLLQEYTQQYQQVPDSHTQNSKASVNTLKRRRIWTSLGI
ncbi:hypothetical protein Pmani_003031 [Petrolisthes manimaculis]|uniref:Uncharacterized protein n=1 Tax=Petrolisthes manimaculis TaxID=1843537 RepID=A0AAE1QH40_9EUCA|nr:hypothetical protein Pmani_003031 [Petrolisthes manimaculis]